MNLFRLGHQTVIVDYAHNEASGEAILAVAEGLARATSGRAVPITAIIGTAGDRADDALRGIEAGGGDPASVRVYETEPEALAAELAGSEATGDGDWRPDAPRVVVLLCHEARDEVLALLARLGARPMEVVADLRDGAWSNAPDRPRKGRRPQAEPGPPP